MDFAHRKPLYSQIEAVRQTKVIGFVTGTRAGLETQIADDAIDLFVSLLDEIGPTKKLSLILHTNGGSVSAAWRLINLLRTFCDELEVIVPSKAMSAGTLMSLGADRIVMTKQAALGPIDPSLNHPLGPTIPTPAGAAQIPVSAEAVHGYLNEAKGDVQDAGSMAQIWTDLAARIHPLVLGEVFRRRAQIRFLASRLISSSVPHESKRQAVIDLLCSDSGSHDYTINRREALDLGLSVEVPSNDLYQILSAISKSYTDELKVLEPYSPGIMLGAQAAMAYRLVRGLIETTDGGCFGFVSEGTLSATMNGAQRLVSDQRAFEGWRKLT